MCFATFDHPKNRDSQLRENKYTKEDSHSAAAIE